jgi:predicted MFS family arabinose efflux permease
MWSVLKLPGYRRLLASSLLNELAVSIATIAVSLLVYRRTGSALGATGFFLCSQFGPALVSPFVVSRLDQRSAQAALVVLYALEAAVFAVLALVVSHFSLATVLALALTDGIFATTARVLARTAWTTITSAAGLLREASAVSNTTNTIAYMIGPALGGGVVALGGTVEALLVNAGVFVLMSLTILTARGIPPRVDEPEPAQGRLRAAVAHARDDRLLRALLILEAISIVFFTISVPVEVVFATHSLHTSAAGYGALLTSWGAGAVGGSAIYARWRRLPFRTLIVLGTTALGIGFLSMATAPSLAIAVIGSAIGGVGNGIQVVAVRTAVQEAAPQKWMALILGLNESIFVAFPGVGILLGGAITEIAGPRPALAAGAAGSLAIALMARLRLPAGNELEPARSGYEADLAGSDALQLAATHQNLSTDANGIAQLDRAQAVQKPAD